MIDVFDTSFVVLSLELSLLTPQKQRGTENEVTCPRGRAGIQTQPSGSTAQALNCDAKWSLLARKTSGTGGNQCHLTHQRDFVIS